MVEKRYVLALNSVIISKIRIVIISILQCALNIFYLHFLYLWQFRTREKLKKDNFEKRKYVFFVSDNQSIVFFKINLFSRYKIVVEVVIGEQRGEGVRMGSRCLWDSDTDNYASEVYMNDSLFCCTAVFGLYYY